MEGNLGDDYLTTADLTLGGQPQYNEDYQVPPSLTENTAGLSNSDVFGSSRQGQPQYDQNGGHQMPLAASVNTASGSSLGAPGQSRQRQIPAFRTPVVPANTARASNSAPAPHSAMASNSAPVPHSAIASTSFSDQRIPDFMDNFNPDYVCAPGLRPKKLCRNQPKYKTVDGQQILSESETGLMIGYWDADAQGKRLLIYLYLIFKNLYFMTLIFELDFLSIFQT